VFSVHITILDDKKDMSPAEKLSNRFKWSGDEEQLLIELREKGNKWDNICKQIPGRSATSCRKHYQELFEVRRLDKKTRKMLIGLYERYVGTVSKCGYKKLIDIVQDRKCGLVSLDSWTFHGKLRKSK
jgi:hypothetical protein